MAFEIYFRFADWKNYVFNDCYAVIRFFGSFYSIDINKLNAWGRNDWYY